MFIARLDRAFRTPEECHVLRRAEINTEFNGKEPFGNTAHSTPPERIIQSNSNAINIPLLRSEENT